MEKCVEIREENKIILHAKLNNYHIIRRSSNIIMIQMKATKLESIKSKFRAGWVGEGGCIEIYDRSFIIKTMISASNTYS